MIAAHQTAGAACFDLHARVDQDFIMKKGTSGIIPTGLAVEIPPGYEMQIRARSGLAAKHGFTLVNGIGTIDSDYRGELKVIATLVQDDELVVKDGDRIAQALIAPVLIVEHLETDELSDTARGEGGLGSTKK
jgi:dUTP pyrophosphatase